MTNLNTDSSVDVVGWKVTRSGAAMTVRGFSARDALREVRVSHVVVIEPAHGYCRAITREGLVFRLAVFPQETRDEKARRILFGDRSPTGDC